MRKTNFIGACASAAFMAACLFAAPSTVAADQPGTVATIDGKPIVEADLNVEGELRRLEQEAYRARRRAVDAVIANRLIELEAQRLGETPQALFEREVAAEITDPSDEAVKEFYEQRKEQIGNPLDEVREKIVAYMRDQQAQEARERLVAGLAAKRKIDIMLNPPLLPVKLEGAPGQGPADAAVTIVEFTDFECPYCKQIQPVLADWHERFQGQVRFVAKDLPLSQIHPQAQRAAEAARCAGDQGKLFEYRQSLFSMQELQQESYSPLAAKLNLNVDKFDACLASGRHRDGVQADAEEAESLGLNGTPTFLINGALYEGDRDVEGFSAAIRKDLERAAGKRGESGQ